ncbi:MAG: hypothetical protein AAF602_01675 [Myxococcota bacterium]
MSALFRPVSAWLLAVAVGCGSPATEQPDPPSSTPPTPTATAPGVCDPQPAFARNQCLACHGEDRQGGLDLRPDGIEERLIGIPALAQGCEGRLLVDAQSPENSQLLQVLTPDSPGRCSLAMPPPPAAPVSEADRACIAEWVASLAEDLTDDFEATPIDAATTRVKRLTTGTPPTADELARVQADPAALRELVREWTTTPEFRVVTERTLGTLLQVDPQPTDWLQIDGRNGSGLPRNFGSMLTESVIRTAWTIIDEDRPLTELFRTERWAVTTAMLVMMRYADQTRADMRQLEGLHAAVPAPADAEPDYSASPQTAVWEVPGLPEDCRAAGGLLRTRQLLHLMWGHVDCRGGVPDYRFPDDAPLIAGDDADWRFVEFELVGRDAEPDEPPFFDVDAWRVRDDVVQTRLPRAGFMTTPAFLNNWETNPDNAFRVTTNQMLIIALASTFSIGEPTVPLSLEGLDEVASDPTSDCYGCHRQLDPMRGYLSQHYSDRWRPAEADIRDPDAFFTPAFAFGGVTTVGGDLGQLADVLADHPGVASAWTQKLCWLANGGPCNIDDPEFQRVAESFASSGFDYRELVVELFSSPLVTGLEPTTTHSEGLPVGPQRAEHWCNGLEARGVDSCNRPAIRSALGLLPGVSSARAKVDPIVPQGMTVFAVAGLEKACQLAAFREAVGPTSPFPPSAPETALPRMVEELAGLAPGHERHPALLDSLQSHYDEVVLQTADPRLAMQSAYVVACSSPDAAALGLSERTMDRRTFLSSGLGLSLIGLATGIRPLWLRTGLPEARAATGRAATPLILSISSAGDPVNANAPGAYAPSVTHPDDPDFAGVPIPLGPQTVTGAAVWGTLPAEVRERLAFVHHRSNEVAHSGFDRVMRLADTVLRRDGPGRESLPGAIAQENASVLGALQEAPICLGNEIVAFDGADLSSVGPSSVVSLFAEQASVFDDLRSLREQALDQVYGDLRASGTRAQRSFLDEIATSRTLAQDLGDQLGGLLEDFSADSDNDGPLDQIKVAVALIALRVTPVVTLNLPFGRDNHVDAAFAREIEDQEAGIALVAEAFGRLQDLGLQSSVTLGMLNVFGRRLDQTNGRDHHSEHNVLWMTGPNVRGGVVGGLDAQQSARGFDAITGAPSESGVPAAETLPVAGATLMAATGVPEDRVAARMPGVATVDAVLSET